MFVKFLIYGALLGLAAADVKHLSREYLPPSAEVVSTKVNREYLPPTSEVLTEIVNEVPSLLQLNKIVDQQAAQFVQQDDVVDNNIELDSAKAATKESSNDPAIANNPYGYNGFPGSYPGAYPNYPGGLQGFPGQGFPGQGFPGQGFPGQGFPGQVFPGQGFPGPGFPGQGFPGQVFPGQGFPGPGFINPGFPGQGFPGQGFPGQGFPGQNFPGQGIPNPAYPNYPFIPYSQQLKQESKSESQNEKLLLRVASDTVYDNNNGGYLYNKPSKTF